VLRGSAAAAGLALINSVGSIGGFVGPWAVGLFKDATGGTGDVFLAFAALALCMSGLLLLLRVQKAFASRERPAVAFPAPDSAMATQ
jgi:ACS family tartrate transporter-like MFS transporter